MRSPTTLLPPGLVPAVHAEYRKARSVRASTTLALLPVAVALLATAITSVISGPADPKAQPATGDASVGLYLGITAALIASAVFGALTVGGEFRHGSMPLTILAAGDRDRAVTSKYLIVAAGSLAVAAATELAALACLLLFGRDKFDLDAGALAVLGGGLLAAVCWGLLGAGVALLSRQSGGAITMLLGWLLIIEPLVWVVSSAAGVGGVVTVLPASATVATVAVGSFPDSGILAPTPAAIVVLVLWTAVIAAGGWWTFRGRDL